jgi:hypothetical protein
VFLTVSHFHPFPIFVDMTVAFCDSTLRVGSYPHPQILRLDGSDRQ